uniref:NADH-ubiquinone oxidoreductase chain 6 n=1 Tax=Agrilus discalis TaxID=3013958 RepID=A0A9E9FWC5_9COLE|nr:NADH dehydrogenase subunit 6 [Agrilus discalis]WAP90841.1 NADH dehydrogenase subunit 6 [Agrilus discalis]
MIMLMLLSFLISIMFLMTKHPLSMGFNLLIQSILISMITGMLNFNFWYSYMLFLIMVGGMLILFIYMTSVASNEKFKFSMKSVMLLMISFIIAIMIMYQFKMNTLEMENFTSMMEKTETLNQFNWLNSIKKFFIYPQNTSLVMLMSYLFLTLIAIVKITNIKYGPLRTTN